MISSKFLSKIDVLFRVSLIPLLLFHFYLEIHTKLAAPAILGLPNFFERILTKDLRHHIILLMWLYFVNIHLHDGNMHLFWVHLPRNLHFSKGQVPVKESIEVLIMDSKDPKTFLYYQAFEGITSTE